MLRLADQSPREANKKLKQMLDDGLINSDDYEKKKEEVLQVV